MRHIKVLIMTDSWSSEFDQVEYFQAYPYLKPHILFDSNYGNGLVIWNGLPDISGLFTLKALNFL